MKVPSIPGRVFDRMADRVPKVEQSPQAELFKFILRDKLRLDLLVSCDDTDRIGVKHLRQIIKHRGIANDPVFDYFGDPFVEFPCRQCRKHRRICNHVDWLVK
jgi:hypothetical protein